MSVHSSVQRRSTASGILLSVLAATAASAVVNTGISLAAQALGADASVSLGLTPAFHISFALVGLLAAAVVWSVVRSRARNPRHVMSRLAPAVVLVSLVPDLLVGLAGFGWTAAVALALMHLVCAAAGIAALQHFLPLPR